VPPTTTSTASAVREALEDALWAPSAHNTQPWRFAVSGTTVQLRADRMRALPVNDPFDRELTMSCGAALRAFEVAVGARGHLADVDLFPDPRDADLLASVAVTPAIAAGSDEAADALRRAIRTRHTWRGPFAAEPLPAGLDGRLVRAAAEDGALVTVLEDPDTREDLASAVAAADRAQFGEPSWRRELAMWMHPDRDGDGMPLAEGAELGTRLAPAVPDAASVASPPDRSLVLDAPLLLVLASRGDREHDWLLAGRALQRLLLLAASEGVQASYLNQACQVAEARSGVRYLIGGDHHPQAILRLGVPSGQRPRTRRRPLAEVLERR
jgi:hypothetical protein